MTFGLLKTAVIKNLIFSEAQTMIRLMEESWALVQIKSHVINAKHAIQKCQFCIWAWVMRKVWNDYSLNIGAVITDKIYHFMSLCVVCHTDCSKQNDMFCSDNLY